MSATGVTGTVRGVFEDAAALRDGAASDGALARWRESIDWTQADLARALQVSRAAISRWESGKRTPSPAESERLALLMATIRAAGAGE